MIKRFVLAGVILATLFQHIVAKEKNRITIKEGFVIQNGVIYSRSAFQSDPIAYAILNGTFKTPEDGLTFGTFRGEEAKWELLKANDKGYFESKKFRGGGFYFEYNSTKKQVAVLKTKGNTMTFVNGVPREGDHYNFGFSYNPIVLKKGINRFYLTGGRYAKMNASLLFFDKDFFFTDKHMTLPDLIIEDDGFKWASIMVVNSKTKNTKGLKIKCTVEGNTLTTDIPTVTKLNSRRIPYMIPETKGVKTKEVEANVSLISSSGKVLDKITYKLKNKNFAKTHDRTFISKIDGSVQYYSVTPGLKQDKGQALFLSVHGASVQARNQARTYKPKSWGNVVAPTNRGPYGFAWEDWGRLDALEVLNLGKKLFSPDKQHIYLTGHSMGGHGTWYLGATYPDKFAAIAPCAGYPDLLNYSKWTKKEETTEMKAMFDRAGRPLRTRDLKRNYLHQGVYVYHGDADPVVSVEQARGMRNLLGQFHNDFTYYEYPGGTHWYGDISIDWNPIFDYFKLHKIPESKEKTSIEFYTANPGVSSSSHWLEIYQQVKPFGLSNVKFDYNKKENTITGSTENVYVLKISKDKLQPTEGVKLNIDNQSIDIANLTDNSEIWLKKENNNWSLSSKPNVNKKGPHRNGNFKDAYRHNMVFVYGTGGSKAEKEALYNKARFDAETFGYRGNSSVEIISDKQFKANKYNGRNIIIYGNASNNKAWKKLLTHSPIQVYKDKIKFGEKEIKGKNLGCYFVYPMKGTEFNSVGVVSGTGIEGFKSAYANQYYLAGSSFPDVTIFSSEAVVKGFDAVKCAGFFGNDWSIENGDFVWKK